MDFRNKGFILNRILTRYIFSEYKNQYAAGSFSATLFSSSILKLMLGHFIKYKPHTYLLFLGPSINDVILFWNFGPIPPLRHPLYHVCYEYLFEKSRGIASGSFFSLPWIFKSSLPILWSLQNRDVPIIGLSNILVSL